MCSVDRVWLHPGHSSAPYARNVAVLRVTEDLGIDPIILNPNANSEAAGQAQTITGWGYTHSYPFDDLSDMLLKATVFAVSQRACAAAYAQLTFPVAISSDMLCAANLGRVDTCSFDSGGPMFTTTRDGRFFQTGVTNWGPAFECEQAIPRVFANVRLLSSWIKSVGGAGVGTARGAPPHDNRRSPRTLTGFPTNVAASTTLATVQAGEPGFSVSPSGTPDRSHGLRWMHHTIWYAWRAPNTGVFKVITAGSAFDTVVNVFDLSRGTLMASNDDCPTSGMGLSSCATFVGTSGRQYLFQFGGYGPSSFGALKITLSRV
jgi:hypothetical protein